MANHNFKVKRGLDVAGSGTFDSDITVSGTLRVGNLHVDSADIITISRANLTGNKGLTYNTSTGEFSVDSANIRAFLSANKGLTYNTSTGEFNLDSANVKEIFTANKGLTYNTSTGEFNLDSANVKEIFTANKGLVYNNSTGEYNVDSANLVTLARNAFQNGTGTTYDSASGQISIGQAVGTTDDVTFGKVTMDSAIVDVIDINPGGAGNPPHLRGRMFYDSDKDALSYYNEVTDVTINVAQEHVIRVYNETGATIPNGSAVYINGVDDHANEFDPTIALARANDITTARAIGIATHDIVNEGHGYITQFGTVGGVNTSAFTPGQALYISEDSAGKFTATPPDHSTGGYPHHIGIVIRPDSSDGSILVVKQDESFESVRIARDLRVDQCIITDSADIKLIGLDTTTFSDANLPSSLPTQREGDLFYFQGPDALTYTNASMNVKIGQDDVIRVYNASGSDIEKGKAVYVTGAQNDFPTIELAQADDFDTVYNTIGLTGHAISNGAFGFVTVRGLYGGLNTQGFTVGSRVYVSPDSAGELVDTLPTFPDFPFEVGTVLIADSAGGGAVGGCIQVEKRSEIFQSFRVEQNGRIDGNFTVAGNLNILGTETKTQVATLAVGDQFISVQEGDTITTTQTTGTGLNDATFKDHYKGDSDLTYFVEISQAGSPGDTIKWGLDSANGGPDIGAFAYLGFDSDNGQTEWNLSTDGNTDIPLRFNITIDFASATGHDSGDVWSGDASPLNEDFGFFGNYNTPNQPFTHAGFFYDASDSKFKFFDRFDSNISGGIDTSTSNFTLAEVEADTFTATTFSGALSGNASTATLLETSRNFSISGDATASNVGFTGGADVDLVLSLDSGVVSNINIAANAEIEDTKLATISTTGKVNNSATTATANNTGSAIVARDASGNFTAGQITATTFVGEIDRSAHSNVDSGTFGSASLVPVLTINASGTIDSAGTVSVAGVSTFTYDSSAHTLTIGTADGGSFTQFIRSTSGVDSGTYGSASLVPVITVDQYGQVDSIGTVSVAGVSSTAYDSNSGLFTISTADGGSFDTKITPRFSIIPDSDITLLNNTIRVNDLHVGNLNVDSADIIKISRGSISRTDAGGLGSFDYDNSTGVMTYTGPSSSDIRGLFSAGGDLSYTPGTGEFSFNETYSNASELMTALKTVDSDGSGLNADTLDGQQGTYYRINVYDAAGTLLN